ncbi:MAG: DnaA regulatory inactivator Hda [Thauera phenolivorans]|uniref:DnaA regulatory inactivator Hda n=1 Tax=Thauera phenolivorans TaxID=1792543 RepID=A0A7X7R902_9RHOO|nr:DnaA regulatory inactivator Hda [Thauera phenolivorans]NLF55735.1 DnaA regulatory inactivator Hda [Thauera phenolivorans]
MRQLVLDIRPDEAPTLDNFVCGDNAELLAALAQLAAAAPAVRPQPPRLYLWGSPGSGRSHLLAATCALAHAHGRAVHRFAAAQIGDALPETPDALLAIDDVEQLSPAAQIATFNAFNRAHGNGQSLLLSGPAAPVGLVLREDLRTRIGQGLIFEVRPLDDDALAAILASLADRRGLRLADEVIEFLLRHGRRELSSLLAVLDTLDAASLERKRPITLPLLRELMQQGLAI